MPDIFSFFRRRRRPAPRQPASMAGEVIDLASMGGAINGTYVDIASVPVNTDKARSARPQQPQRRPPPPDNGPQRQQPPLDDGPPPRQPPPPENDRNVSRLRKAGRSR